MSGLETVYVVHNFEAENVDEISINVGEQVIVLEKDEGFNDGWWQVCIPNYKNREKRVFLTHLIMYRVEMFEAKLVFSQLLIQLSTHHLLQHLKTR
jgi:hypothetical protein